jgi:AraC-like DNA-binding protein
VDVLSDAVTSMRTGRPHSARVWWPATFGRRFPLVQAAGFHVVLQGSCWLIPSDGAPITFGVGDVAFLPRGSAHGLADSPSTPLTDAPAPAFADGRTDNGDPPTGRGPASGAGQATVMLCGAYLLDRSRSHPLLGELPDIVHLPARVGSHPALRAAVNLLGGELQRPHPGADAAVPALLDLLLLYILRAWFDEQADQSIASGWAAALRDPAVAAALRAIHGDPGQPWTIEELGRHAGLSRAALARRFTTLVGQPPLTYLTWWRMTLAARLLRNSDAPLSAVARQVGYTSEFAFAHAFKREYRMPPGGYRRADQTQTRP